MMPNPGTCDAWITVFAVIAALAGFVAGLGVADAVAWVCLGMSAPIRSMRKLIARWWRDWRRGYSDRDLTIARLKYEAATAACKPGSFTRCTMGELRAMRAIDRELSQ